MDFISYPDVLAVPLEAGDIATQRCLSQRPCEIEDQGRNDISFQSLSWTGHAVEPRTGIEFPTILDNSVAAEHNSSFTSEVCLEQETLSIEHVLLICMFEALLEFLGS